MRGEPAAAEREELVLGRSRPGRQDHECGADPAIVAAPATPTTPASATAGCAMERPFDVARVDDLARRDESGLEAVHDPDVAVVVDAGRIARAQPATLEDAPRASPRAASSSRP